ncbi:NADH-ubiquinone oxidoreductase 9.5 kDa subunit [Fusarium oxysporum f. sp. raphani]|uniref:NADH-ubiquinone oxidoreductase 9.5 kDa subunit n=1 Tax=Fusarium oxysporum f. sp. raphani TaxID=96318 RepID=A0A8J5UHX2_FUSOX|nr:NADH-ubiquinone oxidoreductase 9.5 kDa subunit [Fusarium oxysporum f. sp. raphani]
MVATLELCKVGYSEEIIRCPRLGFSEDTIGPLPETIITTKIERQTPHRQLSHHRPALFWSVIIGAAGPVAMPIVPPIRYYFGDVDAPPVPVTYPIPSGPRKQLTGYDD